MSFLTCGVQQGFDNVALNLQLLVRHEVVSVSYKTVEARYMTVKARYKTVKARYKTVEARHKTVKARYKTVKARLLPISCVPSSLDNLALNLQLFVRHEVCLYRGTSLIRNSASLGPSSRTVPRVWKP